MKRTYKIYDQSQNILERVQESKVMETAKKHANNSGKGVWLSQCPDMDGFGMVLIEPDVVSKDGQ